MKRYAIVFICTLCAGALLGGALVVQFERSADVSLSLREEALPPVASQPMFFDADNFQRALAQAEDVSPRADIAAVVVPQHLLASSLIAEQLKRASGRHIDTVVIIGPNHFNAGVDRVASARAVWQTPVGEVRTHDTFTVQFISELGLVDDAGVFKEEHAIGAVAPFVKYYFPDAAILPIAFSSYATIEDAQRVSEWLAAHVPDDSLIVYSIDFSHYLTREAADVKDAETRQMIEARDAARIMTLSNDHLDSPASLATALMFAERNGLHTDILAVMNSDDFSAVRTKETTSYFVIVFFEGRAALPPSETTVVFVGDIMLSRAVGDEMQRRQDWAWPFRKVQNVTRSADILFGNLEGPISAQGASTGSPYSFRADPHALDGLIVAGFDALSVANNHIGDWGRVAMEDTFRMLNTGGITVVGGGENAAEAHTARVIEADGVRFGLLGYSPLAPRAMQAGSNTAGITAYASGRMVEDIHAALESADVVVVSLHFGDEYAVKESASQTDISHAAIDAGAALVIGHHPHVVQRVEQYKGGFIAYSLGNFVFDQMFSAATKKGMALKVTFKGSAIERVEELETTITKDFQAVIRPK